MAAVQRSADAVERFREAAGRARPVALAGERLLPVAEPLAPLLPHGGLRRGSTVAVSGTSSLGGGATSLLLALAAAASAAGSWCAAAGCPSLGVLAATELGIAPDRFPLVPFPPAGEWPTVVAALLDAFDVVLAWPVGRVRPGDGRRLAARARERGGVLLVAGDAVVDAPDVRLTVTSSEWHGLGRGHGHLAARVVEVATGGRGAASRERRVRVWLPGPGGGIQAYEPPAPVLVTASHRGGGSP